MSTAPSTIKDKRISGVLTFIAVLCLAGGVALMAINLYGLTQPIRKPGLGVSDQDQLRFVEETVWSYEESVEAIHGLAVIDEPDALAERANRVVNSSLVHVKWNQVDPIQYRQLIPIWENYFLWGLGRFSSLPQFERYHYADYLRNIRRGIGICGDASTILSSVMDHYGLENRIISFRGHVIVEHQRESGGYNLLDPDFGVDLGVSLEALLEEPHRVRAKYIAAGYSETEVENLLAIYETDYRIFDDTYHFMSKRYLFEHLSYVAKWLMPTLMILVSLIWLVRVRHTRK